MGVEHEFIIFKCPACGEIKIFHSTCCFKECGCGESFAIPLDNCDECCLRVTCLGMKRVTEYKEVTADTIVAGTHKWL